MTILCYHYVSSVKLAANANFVHHLIQNKHIAGKKNYPKHFFMIVDVR